MSCLTLLTAMNPQAQTTGARPAAQRGPTTHALRLQKPPSAPMRLTQLESAHLATGHTRNTTDAQTPPPSNPSSHFFTDSTPA